MCGGKKTTVLSQHMAVHSQQPGYPPQTYGGIVYRDVKSASPDHSGIHLYDLGRADAAPFRYLKQAFTTLAGIRIRTIP